MLTTTPDAYDRLRHFHTTAGQHELHTITQQLRELAPRINELTQRAYHARMLDVINDLPADLTDTVHNDNANEELSHLLGTLAAAFTTAAYGHSTDDTPDRL